MITFNREQIEELTDAEVLPEGLPSYELKAMLSGQAPVLDFTWQIKQLLRRSKLLRKTPQYPGLR